MNVNALQSTCAPTVILTEFKFRFEPDIHHVKVTLTPSQPFEWNALVTVDIDVKDHDLNQLLVKDWNFAHPAARVPGAARPPRQASRAAGRTI